MSWKKSRGPFPTCPASSAAAVCLTGKNKKLYGFYTGGLDKKELHRQLRAQLPVYMVPGALYHLTEFPLTKNGKVDRKSLLERRSQK